jgi:hypothetical protein
LKLNNSAFYGNLGLAGLLHHCNVTDIRRIKMYPAKGLLKRLRRQEILSGESINVIIAESPMRIISGIHLATSI